MYKSTPIVLQNARSRRSVTGLSHTRNTGVEHVHGHATENDGVIMADRVTDPVREVGHVREAGHVVEAGRATGIVTVAVGVTGINSTAAAEARVVTVTVTVIGGSMTACVTMTARSEKGFLPRL